MADLLEHLRPARDQHEAFTKAVRLAQLNPRTYVIELFAWEGLDFSTRDGQWGALFVTSDDGLTALEAVDADYSVWDSFDANGFAD